ncbi:MULE transposase [Hirsutella rhossiliensis]|uniref:MULE transposase domain-containing protein n=1 Tax=Hirsutella rhossiliensis TaxID=111463 RepID=A0A9P8MRX6_9HYPO|nr:MULE transposase domain-containing protein [Hirsutella rhossiliensis]KAH0959369.1 MULE transposase domain-containing protein [Hirsutella rhossiliensis]
MQSIIGQTFDDFASCEAAIHRAARSDSIVVKRRADGMWSPEWSGTAEARLHNHPTFEISAYSKYRTEISQKYRDDIIEMLRSSLQPVGILTKLRQHDDPDLRQIGRRDIVNIIAKYRQQQLQGQAPIEWLFNQLRQQESFFVRHEVDDNKRLTRLFIAPQSGINLLHQYPEVMLFDSTYKTNRFNMPLFNVCACSSIKKSFQVATIFLNGEKEGDYAWAIEKLHELLNEKQIRHPGCVITDRELALMRALNGSTPIQPSIQCLIYSPTRGADGVIQQDAKFEEFIAEWHLLVRSRNEVEYQERLLKFKDPSRYTGEAAQAVEYCVNTWIEPWSHKFVRFQVDRLPHFGHVTTSIVESSHASLKRFLQQRSSGALKIVFERLQLFWNHQESEIRIEAQQRRNKVISVPHFLLQDIRFEARGPLPMSSADYTRNSVIRFIVAGGGLRLLQIITNLMIMTNLHLRLRLRLRLRPAGPGLCLSNQLYNARKADLEVAWPHNHSLISEAEGLQAAAAISLISSEQSCKHNRGPCLPLRPQPLLRAREAGLEAAWPLEFEAVWSYNRRHNRLALRPLLPSLTLRWLHSNKLINTIQCSLAQRRHGRHKEQRIRPDLLK